MYNRIFRKLIWPGYKFLNLLYKIKEPYDVAVFALIAGLLNAITVADIATLAVRAIALIIYIYLAFSVIFYRRIANEEDAIIKKLAGNIDI